jgi:hypothetical protein
MPFDVRGFAPYLEIQDDRTACEFTVSWTHPDAGSQETCIGPFTTEDQVARILSALANTSSRSIQMSIITHWQKAGLTISYTSEDGWAWLKVRRPHVVQAAFSNHYGPPG